MMKEMDTLLAQNNDEGFKQAIYCLSWTLIGAKCPYNLVEKECLVLSSLSRRRGMIWSAIPFMSFLESFMDPHDKTRILKF